MDITGITVVDVIVVESVISLSVVLEGTEVLSEVELFVQLQDVIIIAMNIMAQIHNNFLLIFRLISE
jgi:hypothetical protein